ncbi:MAG: hypothetical protein CSA18_04895 [Deltaproteobacteria bacterium]|nr:MAG: hypothetical protein CSA18_04895 [Deltaproteobacteria bacterium]
MEIIDKEYTAHPFYGTRQMRNVLRRKGLFVNRKRIQHWNVPYDVTRHLKFLTRIRDLSIQAFVAGGTSYTFAYDANGNMTVGHDLSDLSRVTDPVNGPSYNFADPRNNPIGHVLVDRIPYFLWGNSPDDPVQWDDRLFGTYNGWTSQYYQSQSPCGN